MGSRATSGVARLAVESGELPLGDVLQVAGQLRGEAEPVAMPLEVDRLQKLLEFLHRQSHPAAEQGECLVLGFEVGRENDVREQAPE